MKYFMKVAVLFFRAWQYKICHLSTGEGEKTWNFFPKVHHHNHNKKRKQTTIAMSFAFALFI